MHNKNGNVHKNGEKRGDLVKIIWLSVKRFENWSHPIPAIGLGRHTTTTFSIFHCCIVGMGTRQVALYSIKEQISEK